MRHEVRGVWESAQWKQYGFLGSLNLSLNSDSNTYLYFSFLLRKLGIMLNLWSCCEETASHSAWHIEITVIVVTVVSSTLLRKKLTNLPKVIEHI